MPFPLIDGIKYHFADLPASRRETANLRHYFMEVGKRALERTVYISSRT